MEFIAGDVERGHFGVADFDAFGVGVFVEFAADGETGFRLRRRDQFDDRRSAGQGTPAPVLRDVTEQAMLDLVPFRRAGRIVANADGQPGLVGEFLQFDFHRRMREPLEPPPSAVIMSRSHVGYLSRPIAASQRLMALTANSAVS